MYLWELEPKFLRMVDERTWDTLAPMEGCDGIEFLCPKCFEANKGPVGTHMIICWKPHVAAHIYPAPGRWDIRGTSIDDLSLVAGSSSVSLQGGCNAHFFVENGVIQMC